MNGWMDGYRYINRQRERERKKQRERQGEGEGEGEGKGEGEGEREYTVNTFPKGERGNTKLASMAYG